MVVYLDIKYFQLIDNFIFHNAIKGGVVPKEYIPAVQKVVKKQWLVVSLQVTQWLMLKLHFMMVLTTTLTHLRWRLNLPSMGFKEACRSPEAQAVILEPMMKVEIETEDYMRCCR